MEDITEKVSEAEGIVLNLSASVISGLKGEVTYISFLSSCARVRERQVRRQTVKKDMYFKNL